MKVAIVKLVLELLLAIANIDTPIDHDLIVQILIAAEIAAAIQD
jgi:hypothetical protein